MLVSSDDQHRLRAEFHPLDVFRWESCWVDATGAETSQELLDRVRSRLAAAASKASGLPLAIRVELSGPCGAHRQIAARPRHWINEVRAAALDVGGGNLWIEKVRAATTLPVDLDEALLADGPVGELVRLIEELRSDPDRLEHAFQEELAELQRKLPPELVEGPEAIDLGCPDTRGELLGQVRQLLVAQLASGESSS